MAMADNKIGNKMIALCSAAIGALYMAGYVVTLPAAAAAEDGAGGPGLSTGPLSTSVAPARAKYRDGIYSGSSRNRIGSVTVAVTVKNDKIVDVRITSADTHYSVDLIRALPQQVIQRQSERVDIVSGATKSTQIFEAAVRMALAQAQL